MPCPIAKKSATPAAPKAMAEVLFYEEEKEVGNTSRTKSHGSHKVNEGGSTNRTKSHG